MVQQPAEARSLGGVEAPQLSRDAVHEPFMFVLFACADIVVIPLSFKRYFFRIQMIGFLV